MAFSLITKKIEHIDASQILTLCSLVEGKPWSFFLDSCQQTQMNGRYDILVHTPCLTYEYKHGQHILGGDWSEQAPTPHNALPSGNTDGLFNADILKAKCPYENLALIQAKFDALFQAQAIITPHIPFIAGALGVFAYDGNIRSDNINDEKPNQYQLPDISVGFYHSSVVYDNLEQCLYIFSINEQFISHILRELNSKQACSPNPEAFTLLAPWQSNMSQSEYHEGFAKIEEYLRAGDCYQVNFAQRFHAPYRGAEWQAYCQLRLSNNAPFSAFVRLPESTILSLSPERFLLVKDGLVETKPIKGTRKRDPNPMIDAALANELINAPKDRAENLMIVDLLRNDLSKYCQAHSVQVPSLFALESYPAVHHMVSTVIGKLKPTASVYDLIKGAFPGGSITGAPKVRAMQIIQEIEPDKRAIYCGTIGYIGIRGDIDTNICIRTLLAENSLENDGCGHTPTIYCWAGGGIVIDSRNSDEYSESLHKVAKILPILDKHSAFYKENRSVALD